jgi:hypothetical protein
MVLILVTLLLVADPATEAVADKARQEEVAALARAQARLLNVQVGVDQLEKAVLIEQPLLRWSNPTAGSVYGEVHLWALDGRPAAIASIYRWYHPFKDSTVEFVSVSEQPVQAREGTVTQWNSRTGGTTFRDLIDAPTPGETTRIRLSQMRSLARQFTTELTDKRGGDEVERKLRLLEQPVYRYECPSRKVIDGGLFAFVEGTDPEAWLLLEVVDAESGRAWRFAVARMNVDPLRIRRGEQIVKSWDGLREAWSDRTRPYVMFNFDPDKLATNRGDSIQAKEQP